MSRLAGCWWNSTTRAPAPFAASPRPSSSARTWTRRSGGRRCWASTPTPSSASWRASTTRPWSGSAPRGRSADRGQGGAPERLPDHLAARLRHAERRDPAGVAAVPAHHGDPDGPRVAAEALGLPGQPALVLGQSVLYVAQLPRSHPLVRHHRVLEQPGLDVLAAETVSRKLARVLGPQEEVAVALHVDVVAAGRRERPRHLQQQPGGVSAAVVVDVVRSLSGDHGHYRLVGAEAEGDPQRRPGAVLLVLGRAVRVLRRRALGGAVERARPGPAHVHEDQAHRPADRRVGSVARAERAVAPVH